MKKAVISVLVGTAVLAFVACGKNAATENSSDSGVSTVSASSQVENGQKAVDYFKSHPENYYDFILMDVQMPVMNGRDAARTIRKLYRPDAKTIPIFALSADAFVEDERLSIESGMNGHYAKPVDFQALQKNVGMFLEKREKR